MIAGYVTSLIRTLAAYLVAWLVALPAAPAIEHALNIDSAGAQAKLTGLFVFAAGTAYYALARLIERKWPQAGVLLGVPVPPVYVPSAKDVHQDAEQLAAAAGATIVDAPGEAGPPRHAA